MKFLKSVLYRKEKIDNKDRMFGAAEQYYPTWIVDENGEHKFALFLEGDINDALYRGERNPEDLVPKLPPLLRVWKYLKGMFS